MWPRRAATSDDQAMGVYLAAAAAAAAARAAGGELHAQGPATVPHRAAPLRRRGYGGGSGCCSNGRLARDRCGSRGSD